jgi:hypothetical protein
MAGRASLHCSNNPIYHNLSARIRTSSSARAKPPDLAAAASQLRRLHLRGDCFVLPCKISCCRKHFIDRTPSFPPNTPADGVILLLSPIFRVVAGEREGKQMHPDIKFNIGARGMARIRSSKKRRGRIAA